MTSNKKSSAPVGRQAAEEISNSIKLD